MTVKIRFLGAVGTVTGSKYLVRTERHRILIDAGFFQGSYQWRERNWHDFQSYAGVSLSSIDAVLLTHAHLDHTGILPRFYKQGLRCPIYCSNPTKDLCDILLPDSGRIQEEDSEFRIKKQISHHSPPLPLYTEEDAHKALALFHPRDFGNKVEILPGIHAIWNHSGHILGAGSINLELEGRKITFSGDLGRYNVPILRDPEPIEPGELLLIESTYGTRDHAENDVEKQLAEVINRTAERDGVTVIPSFAVGRTQRILYHLRELKEQALIPNIPVIVDSPMATDATGIYAHYPEDYDEEALRIVIEGRQPFSLPGLYFVRSRQESKKLNSIAEAMIIISSSGMITGGRVLHHVYNRISSPLNTILFVGHQAAGTKGELLEKGAKKITLFKQPVPVRAKTETIEGLSAHADRNELQRWLRESIDSSDSTPGKVAVVHGEEHVSEEFSRTLEKEMKLDTFTPKYQQEVEI